MVERGHPDVELSDLLDTIHDVLSNSDRRFVLGRLVDNGGPVDVQRLVTALVASDPAIAEGGS
jgi:hypothetical protein